MIILATNSKTWKFCINSCFSFLSYKVENILQTKKTIKPKIRWNFDFKIAKFWGNCIDITALNTIVRKPFYKTSKDFCLQQ